MVRPLLERCLLRVAEVTAETVNQVAVGLAVGLATRTGTATVARVGLPMGVRPVAALQEKVHFMAVEVVAEVVRPPMMATTVMAALVGEGLQHTRTQVLTQVTAVPQVVKAA